MSHVRTLAVAMLVAASSASPTLAQRGGGGGKDRGTKADFDAMMRDVPAGLKLSNRDIEDMSPIMLLVDKRKDLKLTDDQQKQLRAMSDSLKEANKPHFKAIDSLRTEMRPRAGADAEMERVRTQVALETVRGAVKVIRDSYDASLNQALPLLDDGQKEKAAGLLKKQSDDAEKTLREKLGGGERPGRDRPLEG